MITPRSKVSHSLGLKLVNFEIVGDAICDLFEPLFLDRMLEESFFEQMREIIKSCARTRQTLLFSATMTEQGGIRFSENNLTNHFKRSYTI